MQRFVLTFFLIVLCLGQAQANAQQNSSTSDTSGSTVAEQNEGPAQKSNDEANEAKNQTDDSPPPIKVNRKEIPVLSGADKIAKKANTLSLWQTIFNGGTLVLAGLATWFAWGAWNAGKEGVKITRQAARAEYQPYIAPLNDSFDVHHYIPDESNTVINFVGDFDIKNVGRTPASNIQVAATIKYKARNYGERRDFDEAGTITNWRFDDLHPDEWRTFKLNFELAFPNGDAQNFMKIREMDIWIRVTFNDLFGRTRCQVMHFLIDHMVTGAHLQGSKEVKDD